MDKTEAKVASASVFGKHPAWSLALPKSTALDPETRVAGNKAQR